MLLRPSPRTGCPLTFRTGGTGLAGQAQSAEVLADVRTHVRSVEVLEAGQRVRVGPGTTLRPVTAHLLRHRRRLGPDPGSEIACTNRAEGCRRDATRLAGGLGLAVPLRMTTDARRRGAMWTTRTGLYAAVVGARPAGSTALLEDVVVPVPTLGAICRGLQELFAGHDYDEPVIVGHAEDGNIHFPLDERLGEHGTGRVMRPSCSGSTGPSCTGRCGS